MIHNNHYKRHREYGGQRRRSRYGLGRNSITYLAIRLEMAEESFAWSNKRCVLQASLVENTSAARDDTPLGVHSTDPRRYRGGPTCFANHSFYAKASLACALALGREESSRSSHSVIAIVKPCFALNRETAYRFGTFVNAPATSGEPLRPPGELAVLPTWYQARRQQMRRKNKRHRAETQYLRPALTGHTYASSVGDIP